MSKRANQAGGVRPLRIGTRAGGGLYEGVLRDGTRIVATCGHQHHNRDQSTGTSGRSARDCITNLARCARYPEQAQDEAAAIRRAAESYLRRFGTTTAQASRLRQAAQDGATAFLASLPAIAALLGGRPVLGAADHLVVPPAKPDPSPCQFCGVMIQPARYGTYGWCDWRDENRDPNCAGHGHGYSHQPAENLA